MRNRTNITTVSAPDIVCGGCASAIQKALGSVEGVRQVVVDVATKEVKVEHAPELSRERIVETLDRAGFPAS